MTYASRRNIARRQKVATLKDQVFALTAEVEHLRLRCAQQEEIIAALNQAQSMERPADLEEWVLSIEEDLSPEEREQWDSLTPEEREVFLDQLGARINTSQALLADVPEDSGVVGG